MNIKLRVKYLEVTFISEANELSIFNLCSSNPGILFVRVVLPKVQRRECILALFASFLAGRLKSALKDSNMIQLLKERLGSRH